MNSTDGAPALGHQRVFANGSFKAGQFGASGSENSKFITASNAHRDDM
jgi:hypothetical protein